MLTAKEKIAIAKEWSKTEGETLQELHIRRWKMACEKGLYDQRIRDKMERKLKENDYIDDAGKPKNMEENRVKCEEARKLQKEHIAKTK
jgi:hypothetical protein